MEFVSCLESVSDNFDTGYVFHLVSSMLGFPAARLHGRSWRPSYRIDFRSVSHACLTSNLLCSGHCCHLCHSLLHASPEEEEFTRNRLTGNCPPTFCNFAGTGVARILTHFVHVENEVGVN